MSDKQTYLDYLKKLGSSGILSVEEITDAFQTGVDQAKPKETNLKDHSREFQLNSSDVLGLAGALIVALSIVILISQNWGILNLFTKLFSTLGVGIFSYFLGVLFAQKRRGQKVSFAFHLISALILPVGILVLINLLNPASLSEPWWQVLVGAVLALFYGFSYRQVQKSSFFLFLALLYGGVLYYSICSAIYGDLSRYSWDYFMPQYIVAVLGLSYALIGHKMVKVQNRLGGFVSFVGIGVFQISMLVASYSRPQTYLLSATTDAVSSRVGVSPTGIAWNFWTVIYALFPIIVLYYSLKMRNHWLLYQGTFFLMVYIIFVSTAYFSGSFGWPLAMLIGGLALIALAYSSIYLNKNYFTTFSWKRKTS